MNYTIEQITAEHAEQLCRVITADLPEYFGLPESNEHYAHGVRSMYNLAAKDGDRYIGLLSLEFPYPNNASIYWMGVLRQDHRKGIGQLLIREAIDYAALKGANTMTVETLSPSEADSNYLNTYAFYERLGFKPLFNLKPDGYEWDMVYMSRPFSSSS